MNTIKTDGYKDVCYKDVRCSIRDIFISMGFSTIQKNACKKNVGERMYRLRFNKDTFRFEGKYKDSVNDRYMKLSGGRYSDTMIVGDNIIVNGHIVICEDMLRRGGVINR